MSFVWSSWLNCFREAKQNLPIPSATYFRAQKALISELLASPTAKVLVARSPADPDFIRGYSVSDGDELHWVYVKSGFYRRQGVATALIAAAGSPARYTHDHEPGGSRLRRLGLVYDGRLFGGRDKETTR